MVKTPKGNMLRVIRAKPNPAGKDRFGRSITPQVQLAGEWIDIKNEGSAGIHLNKLQVYHLAYKMGSSEWEIVIEFNFKDKDVLLAGHVLRVHSGGFIPVDQLLEIDRANANYHVFTGKNYLWNNDKVDKPSIWNPSLEKWIDQTWYDAYPPEGVVLKRNNGKLVP